MDRADRDSLGIRMAISRLWTASCIKLSTPLTIREQLQTAAADLTAAAHLL